MYNLRYHIASLVAVFLALAVGLVLGTIVAERGMITDQGGALVEDLKRRFDEIQAVNNELRTGLERDRAFAQDVEPLLLDGALADEDVVIVVGTGRVDGLNAARTAITLAGGRPAVASIETPGLALRRSAPQGLVGYFAGRGEQMADPGPALEEQVARALVAEWRAGGPRPLTDLLVAAGVMGIETPSDALSADALVVMAADDGGADSFALALARAMAEAGGRVAGAQAATSEGGVAAATAGEGFSAVDHVDTAQGRLSLVWVLAGRAEGYYGWSEGADAYYPVLVPGD